MEECDTNLVVIIFIIIIRVGRSHHDLMLDECHQCYMQYVYIISTITKTNH